MAGKLSGKKIAVLVANGFEQIELTSPVEALRAEGATVEIVSPERGTVKGWKHTEWGDTFSVDRALDEATESTYDGLVLPGGQMNPDYLRANPTAVAFAKAFFDDGKPIAAICHGPWLLVEANVLHGVRATSYGSIRTDLRNAGAAWEDAEVVVDRGIVTSRSPKDLPAFNAKMIEELGEGHHDRAVGMREQTFTGIP